MIEVGAADDSIVFARIEKTSILDWGQIPLYQPIPSAHYAFWAENFDGMLMYNPLKNV